MRDLTAPLGLSQPTISHHLKVMADGGLVERDKRGVWAYYRMAPGALTGLAELFTGSSPRWVKPRDVSRSLRSAAEWATDGRVGVGRSLVRRAGRRLLSGLLLRSRRAVVMVRTDPDGPWPGRHPSDLLTPWASITTERPPHDHEVSGRDPLRAVRVHPQRRPSQMAAGWLTALAGDRIEVRSAGTAPGEHVNPVAIEAMREVGIDIARARPKILTTEAVEVSDVVITMGCGDACPFYPGTRYLDWPLDDPAGQGIEAVRPIRDADQSQGRTADHRAAPRTRRHRLTVRPARALSVWASMSVVISPWPVPRIRPGERVLSASMPLAGDLRRRPTRLGCSAGTTSSSGC